MNSINIGWNKYSSDKIQFISNKQFVQRDLTERISNQGNKTTKKTVHFDCATPIIKRQAFENTQLNYLETNQRVDFEDCDYILSSTDAFTSQLPTVSDKPICSARATVITFIIIVLIIIAAAISVGVIFSAIKTGQNSTTNTNRFSFSTATTTVLTSSVSIGSQSGAPCSSYTTINDPSRNYQQTGLYGTCDNGPLFNSSNNGAWIRFIGSGGLVMASSPPGINHCGGYITAWFNGTLPTTLGTILNGSVCYTGDPVEAILSYDTSVIYCTGGYYIYFLLPVCVCNTRYCTM